MTRLGPRRLIAPLWVVVALAAGCAGHQRAEQNYALYCMGCHGEDGGGLEGHVPDMRTDFARLATLPDGRAYLLRVPGVTQSSLDAEQVAEVLNYALREFGGGAAARRVPPFTATEVAEARAKPLLEITATRASVVGGRGLAKETAHR